MKHARRNGLAFLLGTGLLAVLLGLIWLDGRVNGDPPERLVLREVMLRQPPPPPPPPMTRQEQAEDPRPELSSAREQLPIELTTMDLQLKVPAGPFSGSGIGEKGNGLGVDLGTFGLDDLDGIPTVVRAPIIDDFPEELLQQGVRGFEVTLHILVDERGFPRLISVLRSGYPPYNANLADFISQVRFTKPTVLGVPVRAEYAWPLLIQMP